MDYTDKEQQLSPSKDGEPTGNTSSASMEMNYSIFNKSETTDLSSLKDSINQILTLLNKVSNDFNSKISALEEKLDNPNKRYSTPKSLGAWNTTSDVDAFFDRYNHNNRYSNENELQLGDYVTINDGVYNIDWIIAGFDMEHNQLAADGTTYDNGYGICMIPKIQLPTTMKWNSSNIAIGGYMASDIHSSLIAVANNLQSILGSHLVNRNVLLSSSVDTNGYSNAYTWTTSYCTLMSAGQLTGTFAQHRNQYDDGEANYKLPLFNYTGYKTGSSFWLRGIGGNYCSNTSTRGVRPLIYLR